MGLLCSLCSGHPERVRGSVSKTRCRQRGAGGTAGWAGSWGAGLGSRAPCKSSEHSAAEKLSLLGKGRLAAMWALVWGLVLLQTEVAEEILGGGRTRGAMREHFMPTGPMLWEGPDADAGDGAIQENQRLSHYLKPRNTAPPLAAFGFTALRRCCVFSN